MQSNDPLFRREIPAALASRTVTPARNYRLTSNTTALEIDATGPGLVVLTEAWLDRDFRVTLNGRRVDYLRVNHAFKGVVIPSAGSHRIEFTYRPRRFALSLNLAGLGLILLAGSSYLVRRAERSAAASASRAGRHA